jgi:protein SCO1/2
MRLALAIVRAVLGAFGPLGAPSRAAAPVAAQEPGVETPPDRPDSTVAANRPSLPAILRDVGIDQNLNGQVPLDLSFADEEGRAAALSEVMGEGKPVVLALVYYQCPMLCTQVLNGLTTALRALTLEPGKDFTILTVSFDPSETTALAAAKKAMYLDQYGKPGAADGWRFLTGSAPSIAALTSAVGFRYAYDAQAQQFAHASGLVVLTPEGRIARYFFGVEYSPRDLRLALVEASENRIGTPVDKLLLYCYRYDPATGKYGAVVMNMVRVGGLVTVVTLAGFLLVMLRHERKSGAGAGAAGAS